MKKSCLVSLMLTLSLLCSCNTTASLNAGQRFQLKVTANQNAEVWSAPATEKVLQDKLDGYDSFRQEAKVEVISAKGEYEGSQLIITSGNKVIENINVKVNDLTLEGNSNVKFDSSKIEVFFEKYLDVKKIYDNNGARTGRYPDAIVPMDKIVEYGENKMNANSNQGLYVRFNVPMDQQAGLYTGNLTLYYGGEEKVVSVKLNVIDLVVSEETHSRSLFISEWQYRLGELDSTQAMLEKYISAGLEYRISPAGVVIDDSYDQAGIDFYVETAAKFMKNPKCTQISIPFKSSTQTVDVGGEVLTASAIDPANMKQVLEAFIKKSFEDNFDYVKKLGTHLVDEPQLNKTLVKTKVTTTIFRNVLNEVANELLEKTTENEQLKQQLVNSVRNIRAIITASYAPEYADYIDTWCPTVDYYDGENQRALYNNQEEKWWYTCISPRAPFPTYHIEDTLLSARTMSWMQAEYDVVGNLFWATNVYACYDGSKYVNIEDFYEGDASRFTQVNGDGFLFYPGKPYGIDGPVGSLRLEAIRDGLEEYELLYSLKQNYAQLSEKIGINVNAKSVIRNLANNLYFGTRVNTTSALFNSARNELLDIAKMSNSNSKFAILEYDDDSYGTITYKIYVADGYDVFNNQIQIQPEQTVADGKIYSISNKLDKDVNIMKLVVKNQSESYEYNKLFGSKVEINNAEKFVGAFKNDVSNVTSLLVDGKPISGEDGKLLQLHLSSTTEIQRIKFECNEIKALSENTKKVLLHIYCKDLAESGESFAFSVKTEKGQYLNELYSGTLYNGMNNIEVPLSNLNFQKNGNVVYALFRMGSANAKTIWLKDIVIYNK